MEKNFQASYELGHWLKLHFMKVELISGSFGRKLGG